MQVNIKEEIIDSYERLISNCEGLIESNIDVEINTELIEEYNKVLSEVKDRSEKSYDDVLKEIEKATEQKRIIYNPVTTVWFN